MRGAGALDNNEQHLSSMVGLRAFLMAEDEDGDDVRTHGYPQS